MQDARTATTQAKITFQPVFSVNQWERSCVTVLSSFLMTTSLSQSKTEPDPGFEEFLIFVASVLIY